MKTIIKQISLLIWSGLIIPFYCQNTACTKADKTAVYKQKNIANPVQKNTEQPFSFTHDVAAKLLPVVKYFN